MDLLIDNVFLITMNKKNEIIPDAAIYISDNLILDFGPSKEISKKWSAGKYIDGKNKILMPGLINSHTHLEQTILRGLINDSSLDEWLKPIYWFRNNAPKEDAFISSLLGCIDLIKNGCTSVLSHQSAKHDALGVQAISDSGLRGVVARFVINCKQTKDTYVEDVRDSVENSVKFIEKFSGIANNRVRCCFGPVGYPYAYAETWKLFSKLSEELNVGIHSHISEYLPVVEGFRCKGTTDVAELYKLGALGERTSLVHGIFLNKEDISILGHTKTSIVHCPASNMYFGLGIAPISEMLGNEVNVALGTDGAPSNNSLDLFREMKLMCLTQKLKYHNPKILTSNAALEIAIKNGARVLGLDHVGSIEKGNKADIILVNSNTPHMVPMNGLLSNLVYSASGCDVDTVIVDGNIIMSEHKIKTLDENEILRKAEKAGVRVAEMLLSREVD